MVRHSSIKFGLFFGIAATMIAVVPAKSQKQLYLLGGAEISGLNFNYSFLEGGTVLQRGWINQRGTTSNGFKLSASIALHYRLNKRFAFETGIRFSETNVLVYDARFQQNHSITGTPPNINLNGTRSDQGNFSVTEWYASNYISAYYFIGTPGRFQPYYSAGLVFSYFASLHSDISSSYFYTPTSENLELTGHFVKNYLSGFLEGGICHIPDYTKPKHGPAYFIGIKYTMAGKIVSADYANTQNGTVLYTDRMSASGSNLTLSMKIGIRKFSMGK